MRRRNELHYGEQWKCEGCGRRYDTRKIPLDEYEAIRRTQIRYRLFPLITGVLLLIAVLIFFIAGRAFAALIAIPFLLASWAMFGRPFYRSRYRRSLSKNLPSGISRLTELPGPRAAQCTISTSQWTLWETESLTLWPSNRRIAFCSWVPTTIRSASRSLASWAIVSAACPMAAT